MASNECARVKHQWTSREDEKLVESIYQLFTMGSWKCDTGFKSGYLSQLEKMMEEKLPGCDVKCTPHIESCLKTLKKQAMAIAEIFTNGSGFAWNEEHKMVVCEKIVYDTWVKTHPSAKGLRNKPFPHYDTLLEIYGKDRANGKGATTPAGEEEEIESGTVEGNHSTSVVGLSNIDSSSTQNPPSPPPAPSPTSGQGKGKASKVWNRGLVEVSSSIQKLVDGTMVYLDKIAKAIGEESANSKEVAQEITKIDGLTLTQIIAAGKAIIGDSSLSAIFLNLPDDKRKQMD